VLCHRFRNQNQALGTPSSIRTSDTRSPTAENNATDTNTSRDDRLTAATLETTEGSEIEDLEIEDSEIEDLEIDCGKRTTFGTGSLQFTRVKKNQPNEMSLQHRRRFNAASRNS
jgi:hypothetical protein